jgi:glycosyltransferase involved in cell wall biosynthesis
MEYQAEEVIVVNDASTDGTLEFLESFRQLSDMNITIFTNPTNLGVAGSRNVGIRQAKGEIIAFTDADCVVHPNWISELMKGYKHDRVAAVGGSILSKQITNIWELCEKGRDFVATREGYVSHLVGCNMSFDRTILQQHMFDDDLKYGYEEYLICDKLVSEGHKIYYRPQAIVNHKHRSNWFSLMRRKYLLGFASIWYRKKVRKLFMLKRHILLTAALLTLPFIMLSESKMLLYSFFLLLALPALSLLRDEMLFGQKTFKEILITFPLLIFIELSHLAGALAGLIKFRLLSPVGSK